MKKTYFIQFDFWQTGLHKFFWGITEIDLKEKEILEVCREIIKEEWPHADYFSNVEIKVNSLNNIEI